MQGNVSVLIGAGANITVQTGDQGALLVDTGTAAMSDKVVAAITSISKRPLRYIINTTDREDHTGGNVKIAPTGEIVPLSRSGVHRRSARRVGYAPRRPDLVSKRI